MQLTRSRRTSSGDASAPNRQDVFSKSYKCPCFPHLMDPVLSHAQHTYDPILLAMTTYFSSIEGRNSSLYANSRLVWRYHSVWVIMGEIES